MTPEMNCEYCNQPHEICTCNHEPLRSVQLSMTPEIPDEIKKKIEDGENDYCLKERIIGYAANFKAKHAFGKGAEFGYSLSTQALQDLKDKCEADHCSIESGIDENSDLKEWRDRLIDEKNALIDENEKLKKENEELKRKISTYHYVLIENGELKTQLQQGIDRQRELEEEVKKYAGIADAIMKVSNELIQLRAFVADVVRGQFGELKSEFINRIIRQGKAMQKLNSDAK